MGGLSYQETAGNEQRLTDAGFDWIRFRTELASQLGRDDDLTRAIEDFEPLPFSAGVEAAKWLRSCLRNGDVPMETHIVLEKASGAMLGFYSVNPHSFELSRDDLANLAAREGRDVGQEPQPGLDLALIVRSRSTAKGFGEHLWKHALGNADDADYVALLLQPADAATLKLWRERYRCMPLDPPPGEPPSDPPALWFPIRPAVANWPS